jgi:hypothetical protein
MSFDAVLMEMKIVLNENLKTLGLKSTLKCLHDSKSLCGCIESLI